MHCKLSASDFNGKREQETLKEKVLVIYFFFLHVKCLLDQQRRHLPVRTLALSLLVDLLIGKRWAIYIYIESCGWPRPIYGNGFWFSISKLTRRCAIRLLDGGCRLAKCGKGHTTMIKNLIREDVNDWDLDGQRHCWLNYALDSSTSSLQSSLTRKLQAVVMNAIEISLDFLATQRMSVSLGELARVYFMLWSWSGWIIILSCW